MFRKTFNPGPSQLSDEVKADIEYAAHHNIGSISHRGQDFLDITRRATEGLRQFFEVPKDYHVLFCSSATEAMELSIRNLVDKQSFHFTHGNFSELYARTSRAAGKDAVTQAVEWGQQNDYAGAAIPDTAELITVTYNETSTGACITPKILHDLRQKLTGRLLAVDATSAAGCIPLDIVQGDVWIFSVQKGLGLPSGLGIIFISEAALNRAKQLKHAGLFHFASMADKMAEHQTLQTPNVLGIFLLARQMERWNKLSSASIYEATEEKAKLLDDFINKQVELDYFVKQPAYRSKTTVCIEGVPATIQKLHAAAARRELILGAGYGKLKATTCRIATFPALSLQDIRLLIDIFEQAL